MFLISYFSIFVPFLSTHTFLSQIFVSILLSLGISVQAYMPLEPSHTFLAMAKKPEISVFPTVSEPNGGVRIQTLNLRQSSYFAKWAAITCMKFWKKYCVRYKKLLLQKNIGIFSKSNPSFTKHIKVFS